MTIKPEIVRMTAPGQIKEGDSFVLVTSDGFIEWHKAKRVILHGKSEEEVIYRLKKNHYFITSMVLDGSSKWVKDVYILGEAGE